MDLRCLKTFLYTAELNSFTKAGEALGYSQSTVSFQIRQLEEELNVHLFERVNRTIALTDQGREVLQYVHKMIRLSQDLEERLREGKEISGQIRLAMADSLCPVFLNENYMQYRECYPQIQLKIYTAGTEEMFHLLNHNQTDLVFTLDNHIYHAEYVTIQEKKIQTHFVANVNHPLAKSSGLSVAELVKEDFLLTEKNMSYRRLMDEKLAARSMEIVPKLEMGNAGQICSLVEQNCGISFLPDYVTAAAVKAGNICYLPVMDCEVEIWLQLLHHRDKWISPAMQVVIDYCQEAMELV